ncbi:bacterio-opsin activator domain-containing protein [Halovenus marina]|uniref:bacterio-opsin activator domain-containing protein n=1 Tax=Halovenus marina TaxID=3396621 RepID=UPI003F572DBA
MTDSSLSSDDRALDRPIDQVRESFLAVDANWTVTDLNEAAADLFERSRTDLLDEPLWTALPGLADSAFERECKTALESGVSRRLEAEYRPTERWLEAEVRPTEDGLSMSIRDVTERVEMRQRLRENEEALERLHQIASDRERSYGEKIDSMLAVGRDRFGTTTGFLTRIDATTQEIVRSVGDHPKLQPGSTAPLSEAYCRHTIDADAPLAVADTEAAGYGDDPAYERFGLGCYLGATITVEGEQFGTVCFADEHPRERPFTEREATFLELLTDWIGALLEQRRYERRLSRQQAFTESIMNSLPDPLYVVDEDGQLLEYNDRLETVTGYDSDQLDRMEALELVADDDREAVGAAMDRAWNGEQTATEANIETAAGGHIPYELSAAPLFDRSGTVTGVTGVGRDVTERRTHERRLSGLLELTRSLMQARDREHVAEITTNAAEEILGFDHAVFRLYDSETETLKPAALSDSVVESMGERPVYSVGEGNPGEVFASGESRRIDDVDDPHDELGAVQSVMYYPVGVHGTISIGATERDAFDETDEQLLALLGTSAAAACIRARREREVREAREHTERVLERVNGLIENTIAVLVQATGREELEQGVVEELAATDPYSFACIFQPEIATDTLVPSAHAGDADVEIETATVDFSAAGDPIGDAYREREPKLCADVAECASWADLTVDSGAEAFLAVPLVYKEATYGVLVVFAADVSMVDEREQVVLDALGAAIANAINAVERGRILDSTESIELEVALDDETVVFSRLSAGTDCTVESVGSEFRSDGRTRLYLEVRGDDTQTVLERAREDDLFTELTCIVERDEECLLDVVLDDSLLATLTEYGALPQRAVGENGRTRITVEVPTQAQARELFDLIEDAYTGVDLLGYHERERPVETRQEFRASLFDRFTDRQETALRTAFLGGFFDWPRDVDGNELAEAMGISRPTYHQHLRAAQRKAFEELFESPTRD